MMSLKSGQHFEKLKYVFQQEKSYVHHNILPPILVPGEFVDHVLHGIWHTEWLQYYVPRIHPASENMHDNESQIICSTLNTG